MKRIFGSFVISILLASNSAMAKSFQGNYSCDDSAESGVQTLTIAMAGGPYFNGHKAPRVHGRIAWNGYTAAIHPSFYDGIVFLQVMGLDGREVYAKCTRY